MIQLEPLGECAVRFAIPREADRRALLARLRALEGARDAHLTETHACLSFDGEPPLIDASVLGVDRSVALSEPRLHVVPVIYDGEDLEEVARITKLDRDAVIGRHVGSELTVSFVGFLPGFGYLRGLDETLAGVPRRDAPRARVPAGAVAIAGGFGGIYPFESPGGWRLLGRARGWEPLERDGARLAVGDRVRFERAT